MSKVSLPAGSRLKAALLLVLAGTITALLVWRPWDSDQLGDAAREIARLPGVVTVDLDVRGIGSLDADWFTPQPSEADVTVNLTATLPPADAAVTAERAYEILVSVAGSLAREDVTVRMRITAGEPDEVNGVPVDRLRVPYSAASGADDVADALAILQAGARRVSVHGGGVAVSAISTEVEQNRTPAGIGIDVTAPTDMVRLAELAAELGRSANLHLSDGSARYTGPVAVTDVGAVRLAVDTASRPEVESAVFTNSTAPRLTVLTTEPSDSPETQRLIRWLESHAYATTAGHPVAFTVAEPGYATLTEGWISGFEPPEPEPRTLPLPDDVDAWPADDDAPGCTGADLEVSYGGSGAATGARFASLLARNVSDGPCAVEGVPDITFHDASGKAQPDIRFEPYASGVIPARLVVPPDEQVLAPLQWRAMSTAGDPDVTTSIEVVAVPGAEPVLLDLTGHDDTPGGLDVLKGAEVRLGPWVQALEAWS
jgi:hypothetical protein